VRYLLLGLNLKGGEKFIEQSIVRLYDAQDRQFDRAMGVLLGTAIVEGNRVDVLLNGDEIFPSMLAAIRGAQTSITFESYIYWSGTIDDNRISYGCINVPIAFYEAYIRPIFANHRAVVYVLPEVKTVQQVFAAYGLAALHRLAAKQ
jgi:hypothetical protein